MFVVLQQLPQLIYMVYASVLSKLGYFLTSSKTATV